MSNAQFAGFEYYDDFTIESSEVSGSNTNVAIVLRRDDVPEDMLDSSSGKAMNATRKNVAIGLPAADTSKGPYDRVPIEVKEVVVDATEANRKIELWFLVASLTSSADITGRIYWGGSGNKESAIDEIYGREALWSTVGTEATYHLDDLTTSSVEDSTENVYDGTKSAANYPVEIDTFLGKGQEFDPFNSAYIDITGLFSSQTSISIEAWILSENGGGDDDVVSIGDDVVIRVKGDGHLQGRYQYASGSWDTIEYSTDIRNSWHHVVYTVEAGSQKLYVDGVLRASDTRADAIFYAGTNSAIGRKPTATNYFRGDMTEINIYPDVIDIDYINTRYDNQKSGGAMITRGNDPQKLVLHTRIKQVHTGSATMANGNDFITPSIGATINVETSLLVFTYRTDSVVPTNYLVSGYIGSSTALGFQRSGLSQPVYIEWQIIEWEADAGVRVTADPSGTSFTGTTLDLTAAVSYNPDKTFVMCSHHGGGSDWGAVEGVTWGTVSDGDEIEFSRGSDVYSLTLDYQLVTHHNCDVQQVSYSSNLSTVDVTISSVVEGKSFAFACSSQSVPPDFDELARVYFQSDTTVRMEKYIGSATITGNVFVVSFTDDTYIRNKLDSLNTTTSDVVTLVPLSRVFKSAILLGSSAFFGSPADEANDDSGNACITFNWSNGTQVRVRRENPDNAAKYSIWILTQPDFDSGLDGGMGILTDGDLQ